MIIIKNFKGNNNKATGIFGGGKMNNVQVETVSERLNRLIEEQRREILEMSNKLKVLKRGFDVDTISDVFVSQLVGEEGEQSIVGETGNLTNKAETMTHVFLSNNIKEYARMVRKTLSTIEGGLPEKGHVYKSPLKLTKKNFDGVEEIIKTLTTKDVEAITAEMKRTDLSNPFENKKITEGTENEKKRCKELAVSLIRIANDLDIIFRYYQETVIDAAKTGKFIKLELLVSGHKALSQVKINGGIRRTLIGKDENGNEIRSNKLQAYIERDTLNVGTQYHKTLFSDVQDKGIEVMQEFIDLMNEVNSIPNIYKVRRLAQIKEEKEYKNIINAISYCKTTYLALSNEYSKARNTVDNTGSDWKSNYEANISVAKIRFEKGCALLAQQLRKILSGLDVRKAVDIVEVALYTNGGKGDFNFNYSSGLLTNVLCEEYLINLNNGSDVFDTEYRITKNKGLDNGKTTYLTNNVDIKNMITIDSKKELFTGAVIIKGREEITDENGLVLLDSEGKPRKTNGVAVHKVILKTPQYADDELVLTFKSDKSLSLKTGDLLEVGKAVFKGMNGNNKKFIVPVNVNKEQVGSLVCQCNHEKWFKDVKGNVIETTVINSSYTNKRTMKEVVEYTCIVKIKVNTTIEDIKDLVKVVTTEKSAEYFTPEKLDYQEIFFSDLNEEETTQDTNNEVIDEREVIIEIEREEEKVQEEVQEKEVIIEIENEETKDDRTDKKTYETLLSFNEDMKMFEDSYDFNFVCDYDEF